MWSLLCPPRCALCATPIDRESARLCEACWWSMAAAVSRFELAPPLLALAPWEGAVREALLALKFRREVWRGRALGHVLGGEVLAHGLDVDVVVPVPISTDRARERGFNQADRIARGVARELGARLLPTALRRLDAGRQSARGRSERRDAVFALRGSARVEARLAGARVLLVDDVVSTGFTVDSCRAALEQAGVASVSVATLCYTPSRPRRMQRGRS